MRRYQNLFKALIRLHYSEWEYDGHLGGTDSVESLFYRPNHILRWPMDALELEPFLVQMREEPYPDPRKGVSLFVGYDEDGLFAGAFRSLKTESSRTLDTLSERLLKENYWMVENDAEASLAPLLPGLVTELEEGTQWWRARIGYRVRGQGGEFEGFVGYETFFAPYEGVAISAPRPVECGAGRLNRHGESLLYLASDAHTALSEVRPSTGQEVSVGRFRAVRPLRVVDFTKLDVYCVFRRT